MKKVFPALPMFTKLVLPKLEVQYRKGGFAAGKMSVMSINGFTSGEKNIKLYPTLENRT